jgi:DNA polymerase/3'-5' exonuclease PolX
MARLTRAPRPLPLPGSSAKPLAPLCVRIVLAGSLRRGKHAVGDVELLYISRVVKRPADLFSSKLVALADLEIDKLLDAGVLAKRRNKAGAFAWGAKNKLALHCTTGIPVDLFAATEENCWNYLVCRTGPAALNARIAALARCQGWQWHPYGTGFSRGEQMLRVDSEEEVFAFVGLDYRRPCER